MWTIVARNIEEAWSLFRLHLNEMMWREEHVREVSPRGQTTLEVTEPVCTVYCIPTERVLLDPARDCNPFFHLYESLWILAGYGDVERVAFYAPGIKQFSDDERTFNGAYGVRLRSYWGTDQLEDLVTLLRRDPDTRRGVLQLWDAADLQGGSKDHPCNTAIYVKLREGKLNITVTNRSNDAVWGCYGANAVQFSVLQEYLAARLGVRVGVYRQVSDSLHVYVEGEAGAAWRKVEAAGRPSLLPDYSYSVRGLSTLPMIVRVEAFEEELRLITSRADGRVEEGWRFTQPWLRHVAHPMLLAHQLYRDEGPTAALRGLELTTQRHGLENNDWLTAGKQWLDRRVESRRVA